MKAPEKYLYRRPMRWPWDVIALTAAIAAIISVIVFLGGCASTLDVDTLKGTLHHQITVTIVPTGQTPTTAPAR